MSVKVLPSQPMSSCFPRRIESGSTEIPPKSYYPLFYHLLEVLPLLAPCGSGPPAQAFDAALLLKVTKGLSNHATTHAGVSVFQLSQSERAPESADG